MPRQDGRNESGRTSHQASPDGRGSLRLRLRVRRDSRPHGFKQRGQAFSGHRGDGIERDLVLLEVLGQFLQALRIVEGVDLVGHRDLRLGRQGLGHVVAAALEHLQLVADDIEVADRVAS